MADTTITNVRLSKALLDGMAQQATQFGISRSELFRSVLTHYLGQPTELRLAIVASSPGAVRDRLESAMSANVGLLA